MPIKLITLIKISLSIAALIFAFYSMQHEWRLPSLTTNAMFWVLGATGLMGMVIAGLIWRYRVLAANLGVHYSWAEAAQLQLIGHWFNLTLPTGYVGDGIKIGMRASRDGAGNLLTAVFFERILGLSAISLAGCLLLLPHLQLLGDVGRLLILCYAGFLFCCLLAALICRHDNSKKMLGRWPWIAKIITNLATGNFRALAQGLGISVLIHLTTIGAFIMLGQALGLAVDFVTYMVIIPAVLVAALLPISYAGWGVREISAIQLFTLVGVNAADAMALSVAFGLLNILCATPGLVCFFMYKAQRKN